MERQRDRNWIRPPPMYFIYLHLSIPLSLLLPVHFYWSFLSFFLSHLNSRSGRSIWTGKATKRTSPHCKPRKRRDEGTTQDPESSNRILLMHHSHKSTRAKWYIIIIIIIILQMWGWLGFEPVIFGGLTGTSSHYAIKGLVPVGGATRNRVTFLACVSLGQNRKAV